MTIQKGIESRSVYIGSYMHNFVTFLQIVIVKYGVMDQLKI